jgi:hypothetical protein
MLVVICLLVYGTHVFWDLNFLGGFSLHFGFEILVLPSYVGIVQSGGISLWGFLFMSEAFRWLFSALAPRCVCK